MAVLESSCDEVGGGGSGRFLLVRELGADLQDLFVSFSGYDKSIANLVIELYHLLKRIKPFSR